MKNIVIAGAGPVGLYAAILLTNLIKRYGLDITVTVVDERAGEYHRPGIVAKSVVELIESHIGQIPKEIKSSDDTGSSVFIQDLEYSLHDLAKKRGIKIINANFQDFSSKNKMTIKSRDKVSTIPCDFAIDCTGSRRSLVKKVNSRHPDQKPFHIIKIDDNPIKNHFVAYLLMDEANVRKLHEKKDKDPVKYALALEHLRKEFDWPEFVEPTFTMRQLTIKRTDGNPDTYRCYLYFELPKNIAESTPEKQEAWMRALIKLRSENDDITYKIEKGDYIFIPFDVNPHRVVESVYIGDDSTPEVVPGGDAQMDSYYPQGTGIRSGVVRMNALGSALERLGDELVLNQGSYEFGLREMTQWHIDQLTSDFKSKAESFYSVLEKRKIIYKAALDKCSSKEESSIIQEGLKEIDYRIAVKFFQDAKQLFANCIDSQGCIKTDGKKLDIHDIDSLKKYHQYLIQAFNTLPSDKVNVKNEIQQAIAGLASSYKQFAKKLFESNKVVEAKQFYLDALELYRNYLPGLHLDEVSRIHLSLTVISNKRQDYAAAIQHANSALEVIKETVMDGKEAYITRIEYNKCLGMIGLINEMHQHGRDAEIIREKFNVLTGIYEDIIKKIKTDSPENLKLSDQYSGLHERLRSVISQSTDIAQSSETIKSANTSTDYKT